MVSHDTFRSAEHSLNHFHWRNAQYPGYIELMPVSGQDDRVVLDYGCGPGNDIVGFAVYSTPRRLIAADVSKTALAKARQRLALHGKTAEFLEIDELTNRLPLPDASVDYIHTSGVLHHCADLSAALSELHRVLKPDGELAVMVYNYDSVWLHLHAAWIYQLELGKDKGKSVLDVFRKTTDGEDCPIANCYTPEQFLALMRAHGFEGKFKGAAIGITELKILGRRFDALQDPGLPSEHRDFLSALTFDERGIPLYKGQVAGNDACYTFKKTVNGMPRSDRP